MMVPVKRVEAAEQRGIGGEMFTKDRNTVGSQHWLFLLVSLAFSRKKWSLLLDFLITSKFTFLSLFKDLMF